MIRKSQYQKQNAVVSEYSQLAEQYDVKWSFYVKATTRETMTRVSAPPTGRLLDVGCGTGALLWQLAQAYPEAQLVGVDPVPEMLAVARRKLPSSVELRAGWAERLPCDDGAFDTVVSCSGFHYIRQPMVALREMGRVLRPGGRLIITDWCDDYLSSRICDWYLRLFSPAHVRAYRERECLRLLQEAGFSQVGIERYRINWMWGLMTAVAVKHPAKGSDDCEQKRPV